MSGELREVIRTALLADPELYLSTRGWLLELCAENDKLETALDLAVNRIALLQDHIDQAGDRS